MPPRPKENIRGHVVLFGKGSLPFPMPLARRLPCLKPFLDYNCGDTNFRQIAAFDLGFLSSNRERMRLFRDVVMNHELKQPIRALKPEEGTRPINGNH